MKMGTGKWLYPILTTFKRKCKLKSCSSVLENRLTEQELANESLLLVFAGHETTAMTIASLAAHLIESPALLTSLREEQAAFAQSHPLPKDGLFTADHLKHMPLLDASFRETERLYAPVPAISRRAKEDLLFTPPDGGKQVLIKKGDQIVWNIMVTNRDPEVYPDPDTFLPSRWLTPFSSPSSAHPPKVSTFKLATFGAGHRACLGMQFARMEMLGIMALMVRDYEWELSEGAKLKQVMTPIVRWEGGVKVKFSKRVKG